jgi:phage tail-like protein
MPTGVRSDPFANFRFLVEIDSLVVAGFSEVTGIQVETETEEYREGGVNDHVHKFRKITKYPNLMFKRGLTDSAVLWNWYRDVVDGRVQRRNGAILLFDRSGVPVWRWEFVQAYPVKWTGPDLRGDGSATAIEALELVHKGLNRV